MNSEENLSPKLYFTGTRNKKKREARCVACSVRCRTKRSQEGLPLVVKEARPRWGGNFCVVCVICDVRCGWHAWHGHGECRQFLNNLQGCVALVREGGHYHRHVPHEGDALPNGVVEWRCVCCSGLSGGLSGGLFEWWLFEWWFGALVEWCVWCSS